MEKITHHTKHYLPLVGVLVAGILGFAFFGFDKNFQFVICIAVSVGYVSWGIVHHYIHKDLYAEVVLEYLMIAILGLLIMSSVIFRA